MSVHQVGTLEHATMILPSGAWKDTGLKWTGGSRRTRAIFICDADFVATGPAAAQCIFRQCRGNGVPGRHLRHIIAFGVLVVIDRVASIGVSSAPG